MRFLVKAARADNAVLSLEIESSTEAALREHPELRGCTILSVEPLRNPFSLARLRSASRFPVLLFSRELLSLLTAGLSLTESMDTLVEKEHNMANRKLLEAVRAALYQGKSFSDALQAFPQVFTQFYVATVRASERTGSLAEALGRYVKYQEQTDVVKKRIVSASIYPAVLIVAGGGATLFLMFYVVPRFSLVYEDIRGDIPFFSKLLIHWGQLVSSHAALVSGAIVAVVGLAVYGLSQARFRALIMRRIQRIPAVGERLRLYHLSRLYRTLGMLLRGGVPMVTAIEMSRGLLSADLQDKLAAAEHDIRNGVAASQAMERNQLGTPVSARMLRVGERAGQMGEMMDRTAEFMDEELARWIDWFTRLFEPLLMGAIGIVIGLIVILMYMPIFELANSIQ